MADRLRLELAAPFDAPGLVAFLAARAIAGVERATVGPGRLEYARTLALPGGPGAVELVFEPGPGQAWSVAVALELARPTDEEAAMAAVRHLFDLGTDPARVDADFSADPVLAPLVATLPGIRVPGSADPHELVVRAIVGQQISVAAARTHLGRLAAALGTPHRSRFAGLERVFPTAAELAHRLHRPTDGEALDPERPLRLPGRAIRSVVDTSRLLAQGRLLVSPDAEPDAMREALVAAPGIGAWTAAYIAMRVTTERDAWPVGDVALVAGAERLGLLPPGLPRPQAHRLLAERATAWSPWRSYAAMHLWRAAAA